MSVQDKVETELGTGWLLRCTVCGLIRSSDWGYLGVGWPKHHGYTMRLERAAVSTEER